MFEVLMLFGFLSAVTTSLLPEKMQGTRQRQPKKATPTDKEIEMKQPLERHHQQTKRSRPHCKAYAA
jgi:hypothetical protein